MFNAQNNIPNAFVLTSIDPYVSDLNPNTLFSKLDENHDEPTINKFKNSLIVLHQQQSINNSEILNSVKFSFIEALQYHLNNHLWTAAGKFTHTAGPLNQYTLAVLLSPVMFFNKQFPSNDRQTQTHNIAETLATILFLNHRYNEQPPKLALGWFDGISHYRNSSNEFLRAFFKFCSQYKLPAEMETVAQFKQALSESILQLPAPFKLKYMAQILSSEYHVGDFFDIRRHPGYGNATRTKNRIRSLLPQAEQACIKEFLALHATEIFLHEGDTLAKKLFREYCESNPQENNRNVTNNDDTNLEMNNLKTCGL